MIPSLLTLALLATGPELRVPPGPAGLAPRAPAYLARQPVLSRGKPVQRTRLRIREYLEYDDDSDGEGASRSSKKDSPRAASAAAPAAASCPRPARPDAAARTAATPLIYLLCTLLL
jgi:hypothetical protein